MFTGVSHAAKVAAAVLNPKNFKKSLLDVDVDEISLSPKNLSTGISSTNSFCFNLSTIGSLFSSAKPFQYFFAFVILYRT